jgi:hypothetical protein
MQPPRSKLGNFTLWEKEEIKRIEALSDQAVLRELRKIISGQYYSWRRISQLLKLRFYRNLLYIEHFESGNILYEWNVLCDEKTHWLRHGCPSFKNFRFNRDCLTKLKIIPSQAGLGIEGELMSNFKSIISFNYCQDVVSLDGTWMATFKA